MRIISPGMLATANDVGDEPALVRRRCPQAWLGVHHDRYRAGMEISRRCRNPVFILDDGFQHLHISRDIDIVVVDSTQRLESNRVIPLGSLREPAGCLSRAGVIAVTGGKRPDVDFDRLCPGVPVLSCVQEIRAVVPFSEWLNACNAGAGTMPRGPVFLVAGLGNPGRFLSDAQRAGLEVRGTRWVRDHRALAPDQWLACWDVAQSAGARAIVTTEKDAVKIANTPIFPISVAVQSTRIVDGDGFERAIGQLARGRA
jgi:tetraacyldisaccharide 4'-kinase